MRRLGTLGLLLAAGPSGGCASTWDDLSSRRFRNDPMGAMFKSEDPVAVLKAADPAAGDARARALQRLDEPTGADRDEVLQLVANAATLDPAPWVRVCAIDALGRFDDPRRVEILANAYHRAAGVDPAPADTAGVVEQAGVRPGAKGPPDRMAGLTGPRGFSADQVAHIRSRAVDGLAKAGTPDAVAFLARVADGQAFGPTDDPDGKDQVRRRAVAGLGVVKSPEAGQALARVLAAERDNDAALAGLAQAGLKDASGGNPGPAANESPDVVPAGGR